MCPRTNHAPSFPISSSPAHSEYLKLLFKDELNRNFNVTHCYWTGIFLILFNWTYFQHLLNITKHFHLFWQNWLRNWNISFYWSLCGFWTKKKINLFSAHPKSSSRIKLKCHSARQWTLTLEAAASGNWASLCRTNLSIPQVPTLQGRADKRSHIMGR